MIVWAEVAVYLGFWAIGLGTGAFFGWLLWKKED